MGKQTHKLHEIEKKKFSLYNKPPSYTLISCHKYCVHIEKNQGTNLLPAVKE